MYGPDGVRFYTRDKVVTTRWQADSTSSMTCTSRPAEVARDLLEGRKVDSTGRLL